MRVSRRAPRRPRSARTACTRRSRPRSSPPRSPDSRASPPVTESDSGGASSAPARHRRDSWARTSLASPRQHGSPRVAARAMPAGPPPSHRARRRQRPTAPTPSSSPIRTSTSSTSPRPMPNTTSTHCSRSKPASQCSSRRRSRSTRGRLARSSPSHAQRRLFCMEAMWMRFNPLVRRAQEVVAAGAIGDDRERARPTCAASSTSTPHHRLFDLGAGGGALLDLGIYPITFAWLFLGRPAHDRGDRHPVARPVRTRRSRCSAGTPAGAVAQILTSAVSHSPFAAAICGTLGTVELGPRIHRPTALTVHNRGRRGTDRTRPSSATATASRLPRSNGACEPASWRARSCRWTRRSQSWR